VTFALRPVADIVFFNRSEEGVPKARGKRRRSRRREGWGNLAP